MAEGEHVIAMGQQSSLEDFLLKKRAQNDRIISLRVPETQACPRWQADTGDKVTDMIVLNEPIGLIFEACAYPPKVAHNVLPSNFVKRRQTCGQTERFAAMSG